MKKILVVAIAVAAFGAFAEADKDDDPIVAASTFEIGTLKIDVNSNITNIVIPVCYKNLSEWNTNSDMLPLSQIIKVSNLNEGDHLVRFAGTKYDGWTWHGDKWNADMNVIVGVNSTVSSGGEASDTKLVTGEALWLIRSNPSTSTSVQLFGKYVAPSNMTQKITRGVGKITFMANPTGSKVTGANFAAKLAGVAKVGDRIRKVDGTNTSREYSYTKKGKWAYSKGVKIYYGPDDFDTYEAVWYISSTNLVDETFTW